MTKETNTEMAKLLQVMETLRDPVSGCPWDLEQDFKSIAHNTIEEAYEIVDAIETEDMPLLKEELGDMLFHIVFYSQMAKEKNIFVFDDVVKAISTKMIRRHPHIFSDMDIKDSEKVLKNWEAIKAEEREEKLKENNSVLADVAIALPSLLRAEKLQKRAARVGFDWDNISFVFDKIKEEMLELTNARDAENFEEEIGDVLFSIVNLARWHKINPEKALHATNKKFEARFSYIEQELSKRGKTPEQSNLQEMDDLWNEAKVLKYK